MRGHLETAGADWQGGDATLPAHSQPSV